MRLSFISHVIHTYAIFISEYAGEYRGGGGEYPQNAFVIFKTFIRMFKMVDYAEFVRSCVYWFENSI